MADRRDYNDGRSDVFNSIVRAVILIIVSLLISILSVSFAVHHMRLQYEDEFKSVSHDKIYQVSDLVKMTVDGNELKADHSTAASKYAAVFDLMLSDTSSEVLSNEKYALFSYLNGQLTLLISNGSDANEFRVASSDISDWLSGTFEPRVISDDTSESVLVPITDDTGMCIGVFEYNCSYAGLDTLGNEIESRIFVTVLICLAAGIVLFVIQEFIIRLLRKNQGKGSSSSDETPKNREKRLMSSTIGYCFSIVLVVLIVMSNQLSDTYVSALESERADTMQKITVASSTILGYEELKEGMSYPLPIYSYDEGKDYLVDIFTKSGDSFLRFYSSTSADSVEPYYLTGANDKYINAFDLQQVVFTSRVDDGVNYVACIAPVISSDNTVAGILELRMPRDDFQSSVNGMSLSWIFTIISIAISMAILIFELNLLVSTITRGISGNAPILVMYGSNANRFLSFFQALGASMIPIIYASFIKDKMYDDYDYWIIQMIIGVGLLFFAFGFFGFATVRRTIKSRLTNRIALMFITAIGYFFALLAGLLDNPFVLMGFMLPIGFCFGMPFDYLRDYRLNAGKLGYKNFEDRTIHNIQQTAYFLGVSVGGVVSGICYERFGLMIVAIICGATLILTSLGMVYFMRNNTVVKESFLSVSRWLQLFSDKKAGRFLTSSFIVLGMIISFFLAFMPNFLGRVNISTATSAFYYLVAAFMAIFTALVVKIRFSYLMTSRNRVLIQSTAAIVGFLVFALMPTAKILVITCALLGFAMGMHDFTYAYNLYEIVGRGARLNIKRACELTLLLGLMIMIPIYSLALAINQTRIVFLIFTAIFIFAGYIYPMSGFSYSVGENSKASASKPKKNELQNPADVGGNNNG
ncbi:MAG: MFS transporter [Clostridiales bacterium]|nr:MFS transporter [Clostridiales bacterium]